uniref:GIY-YIG homing endonuclease n=1 Tax=Ophiostoma novo-ulmi subsp. novo-ulmi TaxID=170179 RepID=A0A2L1IPV8_OPHNO|nr:GIY-YIG homing endonuclease [Ophiostoma novo-ulmi subsp. novo-ulmi]
MHHLVLPLNITICWEVLTIILLVITVTMSNFEQSAGNQRIFSNILVGTSETTRDTCNTIAWRYSPWNKKSLIPLYNHNKTIIRHYSHYNNQDIINNLKPVVIYDNFKEDKSKLLKEQKDKSGVYCLINKENNHSYVGSSINLASRMKNYLNDTFLKSRYNINMPIVKALLKYGKNNFTLYIL